MTFKLRLSKCKRLDWSLFNKQVPLCCLSKAKEGKGRGGAPELG